MPFANLHTCRADLPNNPLPAYTHTKNVLFNSPAFHWEVGSHKLDNCTSVLVMTIIPPADPLPDTIKFPTTTHRE